LSRLTPEASLKLTLLAHGVAVTPDAEGAWLERFGGPLTLAEHATTLGIVLVLPGRIYVNACVVRGAAASVPTLHVDADEFLVSHASLTVPVGIVPVPAFHKQQLVDRLDGERRPYTRYGVTHTDRCRVSPIAGCAWQCQFCDLPYTLEYRKKHADDLLAVIVAAKEDPITPARHVLVSGGTPRKGPPGRSDEDWIDDIYTSVAARSPLPVEVMMPVRSDLSYLGWLRSIGVSAVSLNLEVSDWTRMRTLAPAKARAPRSHVLDYLERAVSVFGVGAVQSLLVFGAAVEPLESTLRGVEDVVALGCVPVLSPFRPHPATPMRNRPAATAAEMLWIYERTLEVCDRVGTGLAPGPTCVPCQHNSVAFPSEVGGAKLLEPRTRA